MDRSRRSPSQRQLRVGEAVRHALSAVVARGELHDPTLQDVSITVSEVRMSPDLRTATAFVLPLGGRQTGEVVAALRHAAPFLRQRLASAVPLKFVPDLRFEADTTFDVADRIDRLLRERDVGAEPPGGEASSARDDDHGP